MKARTAVGGCLVNPAKEKRQKEGTRQTGVDPVKERGRSGSLEDAGGT